MDEEQDNAKPAEGPGRMMTMLLAIGCIAGMIYALTAPGSHPILDFLSLLACIPYPLFEAKKRHDKKKSNKNKDEPADNTSHP